MNEIESGITTTSLEDTPEVIAPIAPVETPPPVDTAAEEPEPEGTITIPQGKVVPLGAVQAERGKRKEAEKALAAKDAEINAYREKAQRYDEASQYLEQARPIIEKIKARPDILKLADQPPAPTTPAVDPALEAEALEIAKDLDLFTPDGKHDVARGLRILQRNDARAARQAQQAVHPILQTEAQRQSQALYQHFLNQPEVNGFKVDKNLLDEAWRTVPPEVSADPRVAEVLYTNALGRAIRSGHKPITAPPPVVPTESLGGNGSPSASLNDTSQRFMSSAGIAKKTFTELREQFKPGQSNSLEP